MVDDADTRGHASAVKVRRPEDDTHSVPDDHVTGRVRVGTRADSKRRFVLSHLVGHETGELGSGREVAVERGPRVPRGRVDEMVPAVRNALNHLGHVAGWEQGAEGATRRASTYVGGDDGVDVKRAVVKR